MPSHRFAQLKAAVLLAVGFVVLRVVYRVVFGGGSGSGLVLFEIPRIRLGGPFEHVTLFGPVTTGGVAAAAASAIPFAALVLALGILTTIVDIRALLTRGAVRGPMRTVSRALVIAWATLPALLESVRRVRRARALRGERGPAALVVPVLEQTVERAVALGASMEVRGFAATRPVSPECERPASLREVSLGFDDSAILEHVGLELATGTLTIITGATGSGKSTLLHALSGLTQHLRGGDQTGMIEVAGVDRLAVPPRDTAGFVGVVPQSVRLSFVAATVREEIGFTLAIRGVAAVIVAARVDETAQRLSIAHLLDRPVEALSAGEACLVAIAAAIVERPVLLLLDEPLADLDARARTRIVALLDALAHEAGVCVVVVEHAIEEWGSAPDEWLELLAGGLRPRERANEGDVREAETARAGDVVAVIRDLSVLHGDRPVVDGASLDLCAGEVVALRGPNGAGKSSLLQGIALARSRGAVTIGGEDVAAMRSHQRRSRVTLVPEAFDDLLFATTVARECRRANRHTPGADTAGLFLRFIDAVDPDILDRHPRDLSAGERLCLVIAIQLAPRPSVLLVDEPSRGLDARARALVGSALCEAATSGTAVIFATHDETFAARFASREIGMACGHLSAGAEVAS